MIELLRAASAIRLQNYWDELSLLTIDSLESISKDGLSFKFAALVFD